MTDLKGLATASMNLYRTFKQGYQDVQIWIFTVETRLQLGGLNILV